MPNLTLDADDFDQAAMLPRKRKPTAVQDHHPAGVTVDDSARPASSTANVVSDSLKAVGEVASSMDRISIRQRHAQRVAAAAASPSQCLSLAVPVSMSLDADRAAKRARLEQHWDQLAIGHPLADFSSSPTCSSPQYPSSPASRTSPHHSFHKKRSYSLPNLRSRALASEHFRTSTAATQRPTSISFTRSGSAPPGFPLPGKRYTPPPHVPNVYPLINRETLKELDLEAILRNPQLRHDLLLDAGLQFQPTMSRRKRELTHRYWIAVQRELETGCTCTAFDSQGNVLECLCRHRSTLSPANERSPRLNMPSRIQPLVNELLEVLLSVIAPQPSQPSRPSSPTSSPKLPTTVFQHESHSSQEAQLRAALDSHLIEQELSHGVFDPSGLFTLLGSVLKCHCAPMRDRMVDSMVATARNCRGNMEDATNAIRMCFDTLELMKLDIANHQLLALRPYLLASASEFELRTFQERFANGEISLIETASWLKNAYAKHQAQPSPSTSKIATTGSRSQRIHMALLHALTESAFAPYLDLRDRKLPETLYMDQARLAVLSQEASDLLGLYLLLMLARQLSCSPSTTRFPRKLEADELHLIKREIIEVGSPERPGRFLYRDAEKKSGKPAKGSSRSAAAAGAEGKTPMWRKRLESVLLQVAARATNAAPPKADNAPALDQDKLPEKSTLDFLNGWAASNLTDRSSLATLLKTRVQDATMSLLLGDAFPSEVKAEVERAEGSWEAQGLSTLSKELHLFASKLSNFATWHWKIYGPLYEAKGFLDLDD